MTTLFSARNLVLVLVLSAGATAAILFFPRSRPPAPQLPVLGSIPAFSLVTERNQTITNAGLLGRVTVADFIFTNCAGPCPLMSAKMYKLQEEFRPLAAVRMLSFSVDPEEDTPQVLREYGIRFQADSLRWTFVTGRRPEVESLVRNGFRLVVDKDSEGILHSTKFVLIDQRAAIRGYYDSEDDSMMIQMAADVRSLAAAGSE